MNNSIKLCVLSICGLMMTGCAINNPGCYEHQQIRSEQLNRIEYTSQDTNDILVELNSKIEGFLAFLNNREFGLNR